MRRTLLSGLRRLRLKRRLVRAAVPSIVRAVKAENLTYVSYPSFRNIERCIRTIGRDRVPGMFIEAGVALGGSAIVIAKLMPVNRQFRGYDVFGMIPPPGDEDGCRSQDRYTTIASGDSPGIGGDVYYGYQENLYEKVCAAFAAHGIPVDGVRVSLHQGLFEDTLDVSDATVAFAHLDCDWYEPMKVCLDRIYPTLARGGFIVSDDYHTYGGAAKAVDEFLEEHSDVEMMNKRRVDPSANVVLRRRAAES